MHKWKRLHSSPSTSTQPLHHENEDEQIKQDNAYMWKRLHPSTPVHSHHGNDEGHKGNGAIKGT